MVAFTGETAFDGVATFTGGIALVELLAFTGEDAVTAVVAFTGVATFDGMAALVEVLVVAFPEASCRDSSLRKRRRRPIIAYKRIAEPGILRSRQR